MRLEGPPREGSIRESTGSGLAMLASGGGAWGASQRVLGLGRCRQLGLGLEFMSSCWGGEEEGGRIGGLAVAQRTGGGESPGGMDSGPGATGRGQGGTLG